MDFLSHVSVKSVVGYLVALFVLLGQYCGVDFRDLAPSISLVVANLANAVAALVPLAFAVWGHVELAKKHAALVNTPALAMSAKDAAKVAALIGLAFIGANFLSGCSQASAPPAPSPAPAATTSPSGASGAIEAALPLIRTGAAVATGAVLDFTVRQASTRTRLANEMYAAASAIYSLSGGAFPSPTQLQATVTSFGGSQADANYAQFASGISSLYALYYPKLAAGDGKTAAELLNAIAGGVEDATASYVTTTTAATSAN